MYGAPTILVVLADANAKCAVQDGSLVMGNLMLAAASLGLGSCWINRAREEFEMCIRDSDRSVCSLDTEFKYCSAASYS